MTEKDMIIQDLRRENAKLKASVPQWISVDDRLPKEKVICIVCYKHAYCDNDGYWTIGICFYDGEKFQMHWAYKVTHWMSLPELPKED